MTHTTTCCRLCFQSDSKGEVFDFRCLNKSCPCHTTTQGESWEERLMDEFCVMFERADRELSNDNWVLKLESFISTELHQERKRLKREIFRQIGDDEENSSFKIAINKERQRITGIITHLI